MKKVLVGSVFKNTAPDQIEWLKIQLKFLEATTDDYEHVVFLNCEDPSPFDKMTKVVGHGDGTIQTSQQHMNGLNGLADYFRSVKDQYDGFLFIDNDAFPMKIGWLEILLSRMGKHNKTVAIALRTENLENRLHASVMFCKPESLEGLNFYFGETGKDLLNYEEKDVGIGQFQIERRNEVLPLIRTNKMNIHPISCGVYFDMFYHHAFGSPTKATRFRTELRDYSTHYYGESTDFPALQNAFLANPWFFVSRLAGWCPEQYPGNPDLCKGGTAP